MENISNSRASISYLRKDSVYHEYRFSLEKRKSIYEESLKFAKLIDTGNQVDNKELEEFKVRLNELLKCNPFMTFPYFLLPELYQSLLKIYENDHNQHILKCLELNMLWSLRQQSLSDLIYYLRLLVRFRVDKQIIQATYNVIENKINENVKKSSNIDFQSFYLIYQNHDLFHDQFLQNRDLVIAKLANNLSFKDICKLMGAIIISKRRNLVLLRALANNISKQKEILDINYYSELLYNLRLLSFPNNLILNKISNDLIEIIPSVNNAFNIRLILISIAYMKWRDVKLFDTILTWVEKNIEMCTSEDLISLIITISNINYNSDNADSILDKAIERITEIDDKKIWLNYVWSLIILNKHKPSHISSVLNNDYQNNLDEENFAKITNVQKLDLIKFIKNKDNIKDINVLINRSNHNLIYSVDNRKTMQSDILKILSLMAPVPMFLLPHIKTRMGFNFYGEIIVDTNNTIKPIHKYSSHKKDLSRAAILIWDFSDYTIGDQKLLGYCNFIGKMLRQYNYKILEIPYFEYVKYKTPLQQLKYLEQKIKDL